MMKKTLSLLTVLFAIQPLSSQAGVTLLGGLNFAGPSYTNASTAMAVEANSAVSFGVLFDQSFTPLFAVESGLLYSKEKSSVTSTGFAATLATTRLHIPIMLRMTALPFVSVGVGLYYENGMGDVTVDYTVPTTTSVTQSYSDSSLKKEDYGMDFDVRFKMPLTPGLGLVLDGRYQLGLMQRSTDTALGSSYKSKNITALAGVQLGF